MPFGRQRKEFPSDLWTQCPTCGEMLFNKQLARNHNVCTNCAHHFRLGARERIELLVDKGSFAEVAWVSLEDHRRLPFALAAEAIDTLHRLVSTPGAHVYVHCRAGVLRSPTVIWL